MTPQEQIRYGLRTMNNQNRPAAGFDSPNAPHSTMQIGYHSPAPTEGCSRQELRRRLRDKAKLEAAGIRIIRGEKRIPLTVVQREYVADSMFERWLKQINEACAKESLSKIRYPRYIVDQVMTMQNVHDDVVKEAMER